MAEGPISGFGTHMSRIRGLDLTGPLEEMKQDP